MTYLPTGLSFSASLAIGGRHEGTWLCNDYGGGFVKKCLWCPSSKVHAKGLCKKCYDRMSKSDARDTVTPSYAYRCVLSPETLASLKERGYGD